MIATQTTNTAVVSGFRVMVQSFLREEFHFTRGAEDIAKVWGVGYVISSRHFPAIDTSTAEDWMHLDFLETGRLQAERLTPDHLPDYLSLLRNPHVMQTMSPDGRPLSAEVATE